MDNDLSSLEQWVGGLLARLTPNQRRAVNRRVVLALRRSQQQRIAAQRNPDGSAFAARKPQHAKGSKASGRGKAGRIRRKAKARAMFRKLRTATYLKTEASGSHIAVGFTASAARLGRVHQYGLRDRVARKGAVAKYAARKLLGLTDTDRQLIAGALLDNVRS